MHKELVSSLIGERVSHFESVSKPRANKSAEIIHFKKFKFNLTTNYYRGTLVSITLDPINFTDHQEKAKRQKLLFRAAFKYLEDLNLSDETMKFEFKDQQLLVHFS